MRIQRYITVFIVVFLCSCATQPQQGGENDMSEVIRKATESLNEDASIQPILLSIDAAIERAVEKNLDARIAALEVLVQEDSLNLERLRAFPEIRASMNYFNRSNLGAASSQSIITGRESLEPSFSTEPVRSTADLSASWNLLDLALTVFQSKTSADQTAITASRYEKTLQNITRDVRAAYWRAYAWQENVTQTLKVLKRAENYIGNLDHADRKNMLGYEELAQRRQNINQAAQSLDARIGNLELAMIELKSLLSYPQSQEIHLISRPDNHIAQAKKAVTLDVKKLEQEAINSRPEIRQALLQEQIADREVRQEIVRTLPGADLFLATNRDSNRFLVDNEWINFSASIAQNLTSLLTLPARRRAAKNRAVLTENQTLAQVAAILAQVHVAQRRLDNLTQLYRQDQSFLADTNKIARAARIRKSEGLLSGQDSILAELQAQTAKLQAQESFADVQDAYAVFLNTLGGPKLRT